MMPRAHSFGVWLLAFAIALAAAAGLAADPGKGVGGASATATVSAGAAPSAKPATAAPAATTTTASAGISGMAPMPGDQKVPTAWLPPGAFSDDNGPSDVIFPPRQLTLRFNHKLHTQEANGPNLKHEPCHKDPPSRERRNDKLPPAVPPCDPHHM